ncbi:FecCD family ABC transporter permease [Motiliproteus sediminis]|uniref:FecCD family ABC transporter permease n=1 Tax=Motiliproteus sediminis TaxID=1468178 RepID=UPI001AEF9239|nr:iron ABC transporter permease [Motiliproteus sediminis]
MSRINPLLVLLLLALLLVVSLVVSLGVGSYARGFADLPALLFGSADSLERAVMLELRLPRALSAMVVGAQLSLAGVMMQALLRNPLADPYVLGVSGGASVAALITLILGFSGFWVAAAAFAGAMINVVLVFGLVSRAGDWSPGRLLLTGVVIASGWGAVVSFLLAVSEGQALKSMLFWLMGDFSHVPAPGWHLLVLLVGLLFAWAVARPLNLVVRGALQAQALGVDPRPLRLGLFLVTSLLTASAVTQAGSVGFLGLVVPHMLRLLIGSDHRWLVPGAALGGATLLLAADTLARTVIAPQQLPVGVITAFLGVPLFLWLLNRNEAQR